MKAFIGIMLTALLLVFAVNFTVRADETEKAPAQEKKTELKPQTVCPVMGGAIDKKYYTDIQGQRVYHCCPSCAEVLKADPDKYFKKAAAAGVQFENIQTVCPVSGESIDKDVSIYHEGRTVYFCCEHCVGTFEKDPQTYLSKLNDARSASKADENQEKSSDDHKGHDH